MTTAQMITAVDALTGVDKSQIGIMLPDTATLTDAKLAHAAGYMILDDKCSSITTDADLATRLNNITKWGYDYANLYLLPPPTNSY